MNNTRTKHRNHTSTVIAPSEWDGHTTVGLQSRTLEFQLPQSTEYMQDSKKLRRAYNACYHEKGKLLSIAAAVSPHEYDTSGDRWITTDVGSHLWYRSGNPALKQARELVIGAGGEPPNDLIAFYMRRIVKEPPQVLSLINFLWELREFKSMFHVWRQKFGFLHNIASTRLGYEYGWKLFLQDCVGILNSIKTLDKRVKAYLDGMGTVKQGRYRVRLSDTTNGIIVDNPVESDGMYGTMLDPDFPGFRAKYDMSWRLEQGYEVANLRYSYFLPELSAFQMQARFLLHAFGVEWNPRIIWDAIPYSFVIDWFVSVGEWIEDWYAYPLLPVHVRVHDFSITRKAKVYAAVRYRWTTEMVPTPPKWAYHNVNCVGSVYKRVVDLHPKPTPIELVNAGFSKFGRTRFLNGASLVIVNTRIGRNVLPRKIRPTGKRRRNPLVFPKQDPKAKFLWPEKPWAPKYSKSFLEDFALYQKAVRRDLYARPSIDKTAPGQNTAWAVRFKRKIGEAGAEVFLR